MNPWNRASLDDLKNQKPMPTALFLDDGGALNDNSLRAPEWRRLIAEFMPARMGGLADRWAKANQVVFPQVWKTIQKRLAEYASYEEVQRTYAITWMSGMCAFVGITPPKDDDAVALYKELSIYVAERANSAITGAADAILSLHRAGHTLYMASGTASWDLRGIMTKMGIAETISAFYGPDLIDHVKYGPAYYRKIFDHAGVAPNRAVVIESDLEFCRWASEAGAKAVWVDPEGGSAVSSLEMPSHVLD